MKKFIIMLSIFIVSGVFNVIVFAQTRNPYTNDFINAMQYCKPYTYSIGPIEMFGMQITTKKQIVGIKDGLCSYVEIVGPPDAKNTIRCSFTKEQVNKLVHAMRNNNGDRVWTEYCNNDNVCSLETPD